MNSLIIALATLSVAYAVPSGLVLRNSGLGLAGPVGHRATIVGPTATIIGPSAVRASIVGPSGHSPIVGPSLGLGQGLVGGVGLGLRNSGLGLARPVGHRATIVGPTATIIGPSAVRASIVGPSGHSPIVGPSLGLRQGLVGEVGLGLANGLTVAGPGTVPATITGPSGSIQAAGLWGPTLAHGSHW